MDNAENFLAFLDKYDLIQIPRIQRDYVQGGENTKAKDIRETFVGDLCNAIKENKVLSLDFIYGNVEMIGDKRCFYPLDGQQRLTTLFLLHWYGALFLDKGDDVRKELQKFSYQTRFSSEQFCKLLFNEGVIDSVKKCSDGQKISEAIKDDPGYSKFWKYDPTVDSMLNMLDCIQDASTKQKIKWENDFANTIKFYVYEIKDSQEPDDLYVKMNARGKHLTNFENLKAHLQQWMNDCDGLDDAFKKAWKDKMDADWSYFFWNAEEHKELEKLSDPAKDFIDKPFWVFLNRIAILGYILNNLSVVEVLRKKKSQRSDNEQNTVDKFNAVIEQMSMKSADDYISPLLQKEIFQHNPEMYKTVAKILDLLYFSQKERELGPKLAPKHLYPLWVTENVDKNSFSNFFWDKSGSNRGGILQVFALAAYCMYFADTEINIVHLRHWMQFYHQICSDLHDEQAFAGAISMILIILEAMQKETDIYDYLAEKYYGELERREAKTEPIAQWHFSTKDDNTIYRRLFGKNKLAEKESTVNFQAMAIWHEACKCYLRQKLNDDWNDLFCNIESDNVLRGHIQGIISKDDKDDELLKNSQERFEKYCDCNFGANSEELVDVLKSMELCEEDAQVNITLNFSNYNSWNSHVVIRPEIAEAVCRVLSGTVPDKMCGAIQSWREMLIDMPELITGDWEADQAHTVKPYRDGKMHLFKKGYITSGTIVLNSSIHTNISKIMEKLVPEALEARKIGDKIFYVCKSVDCIIGYGQIDDTNRIKFTTTNIVKEKYEDSSWKETEAIQWNEITDIEKLTINVTDTPAFS